MAAVLVACGELLSAGIGLLYGLGWLGLALSYSIRQRQFWLGLRDHDEHLAEASHSLWSLSIDDDHLVHNFLQLPGGTQLHYLTPRLSPRKVETLIIFLHGFPDSAHLFARQLRSPFARRAQLVALDLPGCGGSDSLASYGPDQVLNVVAEAVVLLKERYLASAGPKRKCILVGHDWGALIGFRFAAESQGLFDHLVTLNSLYPAYAEETLKGCISRGNKLLSKWHLREAISELRPVFSQIRKSGYTYMLTLPMPMARLMPRVASCLLKYAHGMEYKEYVDAVSSSGTVVEHHANVDSSEAMTTQVYATRLAMAYGPSIIECSSSSSTGESYGPSVLARSKTTVPGDWDGRVRLYTDGLLLEKWTPSFPGSREKDQAMSTQDDGPQKFKCPVHIIFGLQDVALDPRVIIDGIEKYFQNDETASAADEHIIRLPECGHWSILEEGGVRALDNVLTKLLR